MPDKYEKGREIVAGGVLSPFLGAVYLSLLDYAMEKLCKKKKMFYVRYQDDLVILTKSRLELKKALKVVYSVLSQLKLKVHTKEKSTLEELRKDFLFLLIF